MLPLTCVIRHFWRKGSRRRRVMTLGVFRAVRNQGPIRDQMAGGPRAPRSCRTGSAEADRGPGDGHRPAQDATDHPRRAPRSRGPAPAVCGNRLVLDQASLRSVGVFSNRMLLRVIACELLFTAALGYLPQANRLRSGPTADRHAGAHGTIPSGRMGCPRTAPCPTSSANRLNAHAPGHSVCRISRFPFDAGANRR